MQDPDVDENPTDLPIALYGSLMRGLGAMETLGIAEALRFERPCLIPGRLFDLGPYPGLRPGPGRVRAELYSIHHPDAVAVLDEFEGFEPDRPQASLYLRDRVILLEPEGTPAWVYVYNHEPPLDEIIADGDWRARLRMRGRG
jgi:gamma-glutamylcyclotransferase (GGCT)/AIG2-like uncharacterized protein YtfP